MIIDERDKLAALIKQERHALVPLWQKRGSGLYWEEYERPAENPVTGEKVTARRRRVHRDLELPMKDDYSAFLHKLLNVR